MGKIFLTVAPSFPLRFNVTAMANTTIATPWNGTSGGWRSGWRRSECAQRTGLALPNPAMRRSSMSS
jgi:hypothetical protein